MTDEQGREPTPQNSPEDETLLSFLEWQRATFAWKTGGVDATGMNKALPPSTLTLGGLVKHLALVEDWWFSHNFGGLEEAEPWRSVDFDADPEWEFRTSADDSPAQLRALWEANVAASREAVSGKQMGSLSERTNPRGEPFTLRWVVLHMIEEYARHLGHVDLIREGVDGLVGE
ncbi:MAG: DinB family protein [Nocardioidaceae bacterium]